MAVGFKEYSPLNRAPLFFAELDNSRANSGIEQQRALIIGQQLSSGTFTPGVPTLAESGDFVKARAGAGSMLALEVEWYRKRDRLGEVYVLPLADAGAAVAATGTLTVTSAPTATGTLWVYVGGVPVSIAMSAALTTANAAAAIAAAVNANSNLPVTATAATNVVTFTARNKGLAGNDIDLRLNYRGSVSGEVTPAGLAATIVQMSGGTTNPTLDTVLANLGEQTFDFIVCPYTDAASLDALKSLLAARWAWDKGLYGHAFAAMDGSLSAATTLGLSRNDPHMTILPVNDSPTPPWLIAANLAGACAVSLRADPGLPLHGLALDVLPPPIEKRFILSEQNTLLFDGMSAYTVAQDGTMVTSTIATTYQKNPLGQADDSYLYPETLFTLMAMIRRLKTGITSRFGRFKLGSDGVAYSSGTNIVTPSVIRDYLLAEYRLMVRDGLAQEYERFKASLLVERNGGNSCRVDAVLPLIPIDQLRQLVALVQFRKGGQEG